MPAVIGDKSAYQPLLPVRALTNKSPLRWNQPTGAARSLLRTRNGGPRSGMPSLAPDTKDSGIKTEGYTSLSLFSVLRDADINPALVSHRIASSVNGLKWALPFFSRLRQSRATVLFLPHPGLLRSGELYAIVSSVYLQHQTTLTSSLINGLLFGQSTTTQPIY
ncbi:hypothetical protein N656DRAFT_781158 [Canariomyces notabilis]|uniref:Uncharacterized protein n=1 Tax=Canariomyces notabilis TaxID=2074819 RepID=A0AAN6TAZ5_9PEZI|nr:hypothetical protein N656DRAFT_781158 [Canariomyces arenarius]